MGGLKLWQIASLHAVEDTAKNVVKKDIVAVVTTINLVMALLKMLNTFQPVLKKLLISSQVIIMFAFLKEIPKVISIYIYTVCDIM